MSPNVVDVEIHPCDFCGFELTVACGKQRSNGLARPRICHRCAVEAIDRMIERRTGILQTPRCGKLSPRHDERGRVALHPDLSCMLAIGHDKEGHEVRDLDGRVVVRSLPPVSPEKP